MQKSAYVMNIQPGTFSQREHTSVTSTQAEKENISRVPETSVFLSQSLPDPKVITLLTSNP